MEGSTHPFPGRPLFNIYIPQFCQLPAAHFHGKLLAVLRKPVLFIKSPCPQVIFKYSQINFVETKGKEFLYGEGKQDMSIAPVQSDSAAHRRR